MRNALLLLLSGIGLAGCSSPASNTTVQSALELQSATVCCNRVGQFTWSELQPNQTLDFEVSSVSPVALFGSDKSYFSAFEFSPKSGTVALTLRSKMLNGLLMEPYIQFYDSRFQLRKELGPDAFEVKYSDAFTYNRYELKVDIDAQQTPYFAIFTRQKNIGKKVTVPHPARLRAEQNGDPMPMVTDPVYMISNVGKFQLSVETRTFSQRDSVVPSKSNVKAPLAQTQSYYTNAITQAVKENNLPKALGLLDEAKALGVEGAQEVFIKAVNSK